MNGDEDHADLELLRSFEDFVAGSRGATWLKRRDGRFLALSGPFAEELGVSPDDARRIRDLDLMPAADAERFRADDRLVAASGRAEVFLEAPDHVTPGSWCATLKVPVAGPDGGAVATFGSSHPLTSLVPLERLAQRAGAADPATAWPLRLRQQLDRIFREEIRVAALARRFERHPDHLARSFRGRVGATISEYVRARRVAWAADRLAATAQPIAELALDAGFADQSHLTRCFHRLVGVTPARYRRLARHRQGPVTVEVLVALWAVDDAR